MFDDDQQNKNSSPPGNLPTQPSEPTEDIFAGVDKGGEEAVMEPAPRPGRADTRFLDALSAGRLMKKETETKVMPADLGDQAGALNQVATYKMREPVLGKILFILLLLAVAVGLLAGAWWIYAKFFRSNSQLTITTTSTASDQQSTMNNSVGQATTSAASNNSSTKILTSTAVSNQMNEDNILFGETVDTDKDGLDDIRESQLKTNPNNSDTDGDGLSDGDEVLIWKTDPLDPDSDDDTYLDGREIQYGYNPRGPGKLSDLLGVGTSTNKSTSTQ